MEEKPKRDIEVVDDRSGARQRRGKLEAFRPGRTKTEEALLQANSTVYRCMEAALRSALKLNRYIQTSTEEQIIQLCLEEVELLTGSKISYFHFINPDQETIRLSSWSKQTRQTCTVPEMEKHYPIRKAGVWVDCAHQCQPVIHNDYASLDHKKGLPEGHVPVIRDAAVPIFENEKIVAIIGVGNKEQNYDQIDIDHLQLLAENTWFAIQRIKAETELLCCRNQLEEKIHERTVELKKTNTKLQQQITEGRKKEEKILFYQEQLRSLTSQLIRAGEHERERLAIRLHDSIGQKLIMIKFALQSSMVSVLKPDALAFLIEVCSGIDETIEDAHSLIFELSNPVLRELGLKIALEKYLREEVQGKYGIAFELRCDKQIDGLDAVIKSCLFRNLRELFVNTVKYAKASKIKVHIHRLKDCVRACIEDDGVGFKIREMKLMSTRKTGFGLFSMRTQFENLGGSVEIISKPDQGTKVTLNIPLRSENETVDLKEM